MTTWRVGAVQLQDIQDNLPLALDKIAESLAEAEKREVDILCFPECFLQGYTLDKTETIERAINIRSVRFAEILKRLSGYVPTAIIGMIEEDDGRYFNTAVVVSQGGLIGKYRKNHLFEKNFMPGREYPVFSSGAVDFGVNICYDARFSDGVMKLKEQGAKVLFYPLNNKLTAAKAEAYREKHLPNLVDRARESGCYVVSSDVVFEDGDYIGYGFTAIVDPSGTVVAEATQLQSGLISLDVRI